VNNLNPDLEATTHPFIVRIWLEETIEEAGQATWRGHITHVPSGKRCYVKELGDITDFVAPYLEGMGVELDLRYRVKRWLTLRQLKSKGRS
jgi:hypothetical protein